MSADTLEADVRACKGLVIDASAASRNLLSNMLKDFGITDVEHADKLADARQMLARGRYDIVLCDYHFSSEATTSQELLDELRRERVLPYSTVVLMITSEASYAKVAEAAESALDGYLLKPHSAASLAERLMLARKRKKAMRDIYAALESQEYELAAQLCIDRFYQKQEYWLNAARIGAEVLLRLGRPAQARELFEAIQTSQPLPWAKLGVARAQIDAGQPRPALRTLESLLAERPTYADAFDVKARAELEEGELDAALLTCRQAVELTPQSMPRLQKLGTLAFYMGEVDIASRALEQSYALGVNSKLFDFQSLVLMAQIHATRNRLSGVQMCMDSLAQAARIHPQSVRIARLLRCTRALESMLRQRHADATQKITELANEARLPDFDFEAACNLMSLLGRLAATRAPLREAEEWLIPLAERFCVSRAACELLAQSAQPDGQHMRNVRDAHTAVGEMARHAMQYALQGEPTETVKQLLRDGSRTLNAKLLELADLVIKRYGEAIEEREHLSELTAELRDQYCRQGTHVKLGPAIGREPGGLRLP